MVKLFHTQMICVYFSDNTCKNIKCKANIEVNKIFNRLSEQKLMLNISKCVLIVFSTINVYMPIDDICIHFCNTDNVLSTSCNCQKIISLIVIIFF